MAQAIVHCVLFLLLLVTIPSDCCDTVYHSILWALQVILSSNVMEWVDHIKGEMMMAVHGAGGGWYVGHDSGGGGGGKMGRWSLVDGGRPRECSAVLPPLPPWLALHNLLPPRAVRPNSSPSPDGPRASESTPGKLLPSQEICSKITRHQISDMEWRSSVLGLSTRQLKFISPMFWLSQGS